MAYRSPLSAFPLLRPHTSQVISSHLQQAIASEPTQGSAFYVANTLINFRPLRLATAAKWLSDPGARICQFEVPGGGECRDIHCSDIHLSKLSRVEPDGASSSSYVSLTDLHLCYPSPHPRSFRPSVDHETAQFLCSVLPQSSHIDVVKLQEALKEARQRSSSTTVSLETRAAEVLASLGIR